MVKLFKEQQDTNHLLADEGRAPQANRLEASATYCDNSRRANRRGTSHPVLSRTKRGAPPIFTSETDGLNAWLAFIFHRLYFFPFL